MEIKRGRLNTVNIDLPKLIEDLLPDEQELMKEYDDRFSLNPDIWSNRFADEFAYKLLKLFCRFIGKRLSGTLLDVGCGNGHTLSLFEEKAKGVKTYGIDLSKKAVEIAASRLKRTELIRDNFLMHKFSQKFDFILSFGVFEHFEDPIKALQRAKSILSNNGIFYLKIPASIAYGWSGDHEGFRRLNGGSRQIEWHLRRETWEGMINSAGLEILMSIKGPEKKPEFIWILGSRTISRPKSGLVRMLTIYLRLSNVFQKKPEFIRILGSRTISSLLHGF